MIPYLFVLFFTTVVVYAGRRHGSEGVAWMGVGIAISTMVLLAALRASHVGADTPNYIRHYASVDSIQDIWRTSEIGFNALMVFGSSISESQVMLLFLIAVIVVSLYVISSKFLVKK